MKEQALEVIDSLSAADGVQVLLAAGSEWATAEADRADSSGKRRLREIVEDVEPTLGTANLLDCLQAAVHLAGGRTSSRGRRIIVFTDGQASSWQVDAEGAWQQLAADREAAEFPITIEVVDCGLEATEIDNLAVTDVRAARNLIRPGEQVELAAEITNMGDVPSEATTVEWLVGDKVVQESTVAALEPHAKTQATATLRMADAGIFAVTCRIDGADQVPLDQENSLVVEVADQLADSVRRRRKTRASSSVAAPELFAAALGFKDNEPQAWHSVFRPEAIAPAALATHPLADYRAIVINNLAELDRSDDRAARFVRPRRRRPVGRAGRRDRSRRNSIAIGTATATA